jgi:hypothetical protein
MQCLLSIQRAALGEALFGGRQRALASAPGRPREVQIVVRPALQGGMVRRKEPYQVLSDF